MQVALIQFREVGKKYHFSVNKNIELIIGDLVVVETVVGIEIGEVHSITTQEEIKVNQALKPILRVANEKDIAANIENELEELLVVNKTAELTVSLKLKMNILEAEYTLDRNKLTIYFEAEGRVDFRELVRELNILYITRIELRQIGSRDVAKKIGGIGPCGLVLCCSTFIGDFEPITIRMAKNQNIALNPKKMSGVCGKLMCCLKYENDVYSELKKEMPDLYSNYTTEKGQGKVVDMNMISGKIKIRYKDNEFAPEWINLRDGQWLIELLLSALH